jgi:hypothetical protein
LSTAALLPDQTEEAQLSDEGRIALADLVKSCLKEEQTWRRQEVRKASQARNFRNGNQYLWWDDKSHVYMQPQASGQALPRFMDVYNIYTPHWRSFVSILSQNPPGINFVPDDLQRSTDVTAASYAEKMRHRVDRLVKMKDRQAEAAANFCTDGRTITWTRVDEQGKLRVSIHGVLESKVPLFAAEMEEWGYAILSKEIDIWAAKDEYPDYAEKISGGENDTAEASYERIARLGLLANSKGTGYAETFKGLTTRHMAWIRPSRFQKAEKDRQEELRALYPEGVLVTLISGVAVDCKPESMEKALTVEWPAPGKGSNRPALLSDVIGIQQAFNDSMNMLREFGNFTIPATWVSDVIDSESLDEQRSIPGAIHTITVPAGGSVSDLVFQEQTPQLPAELVANIDRLLTLAQFVSGDLPSLSGEGDPNSETYHGQKMLSDQAKGQLSPAWGGVQRLFAGTYALSTVRAAEMYKDGGTIAVQGGPSGQQQFDPSAILDGSFGCYPSEDSSFPETIADQRASFQSVMTQVGSAGPDGLAIVLHPGNMKLLKQYSGLKDLVIPQADARDKQLEEIERMLQESPVPDQTKIPQWQQASQQAVLAGQPPPPMPLTSSVPIGKRDYNEYELTFGIEWLSSIACREELKKGNQQGVDNVNLHLDLHEAAIQAAKPAPVPKPPNVSMTAAITDPVAIAQLLAIAGAQTTPENIEAADVPEDQNQAADTADKSASAIHKSVLAAKEQVTPIKRDPPPDQVDKVEDK